MKTYCLRDLVNGRINFQDGNLNLYGCNNLQSLPDGLSVGGNLDLYGCTSLQSLPDGLSVGGYLNLNGCFNLQSLPDDMIVKGQIYGAGHLKVEKKMNKKDYSEHKVSKEDTLKKEQYLLVFFDGSDPSTEGPDTLENILKYMDSEIEEGDVFDLYKVEKINIKKQPKFVVEEK